MDEPGWSWPAWKFGMKRDDLFTKLHDQYNTISSSIQDPEAFHHDVYEISQEASTAAEFHRLLAARKLQRVDELNKTLESASYEIIGNPSLIGTEQWRYALQLFQTKSLDSLVRYFVSYLPDDHPWHHPAVEESSESDSMSGSVDSLAPSTASSASFYSSVHDDSEKPILTHEPLPIVSDISAAMKSTPTMTAQLPPSPRSMTTRSDASSVDAASPSEHEYIINTLTPARTMSFSESDSERLDKTMPRPHRRGSRFDHDVDELSQADTPLTSVSDDEAVVDAREEECKLESLSEEFEMVGDRGCGQDGEWSLTSPTAQSTDTADLLDSETPTPRPEQAPVCDPLSSFSFSSPRRSGLRRPSPGPIKRGPVTTAPTPTTISSLSSTRRSREQSPVQTIRRGPSEPLSRIQKPLPEMRGSRPRCARRKAAGVAGAESC